MITRPLKVLKKFLKIFKEYIKDACARKRAFFRTSKIFIFLDQKPKRKFAPQTSKILKDKKGVWTSPHILKNQIPLINKLSIDSKFKKN